MGHKQLAVLAAIAAVCGASACGSDGDGAEGSDGGGGSGGAGGAVVVEATDPTTNKVEIEAPSSVEAGAVRITLENRGDTLHDAQLFKLDRGRTGADLLDGVLEGVDSAPKPRWMHPAGGVAPVRPGASATTTQVLEPGTYYIADTQERDDGRRRTNAAKGGLAKLTVTGEAGGTLPKTSAVITATDDEAFRAQGLRAGRNRVTFRNASRELQQVVFLPVPDRGKLTPAARATLTSAQGTAWVPVDVEGTRATVALDTGREQVTELTLEPRRYVLASFVSKRAGGVPQAYQGMASVLDLSSGKERPGAGAR